MKLIKTSLLFLAGTSASRLITFLLIPFYTSFVSAEDYGSYDLYITYGSVFGAFLFCDVWIASMRFLSVSNSGMSHDASRLLSFVLVLAGSVVGFCIALLAGNSLGDGQRAILTWGVITSLALAQVFCAFVRAQGRNLHFVVSGVVNSAIMGLSTVCLLLSGTGIISLFVGMIAGSLGQILYLAPLSGVRVFSRDAYMFTLSDLGMFTKFVVPLGLSSLVYWVMISAGRFVVQFNLDLTANGLFAIGSRFSAVIGVVSGAITLAGQESVFNEKNMHQFGKEASRSVIGYALVFAASLPAAGFLFQLTVRSDFLQAYALLPGFLLTGVLLGVNAFLGNVFYAKAWTRSLSASSVVGGAVTVAASIPLVQWLGIDGANLGLVVGALVMLGLRLWLVRDFVRISIRPSIVWLIILACLVCLCIFFFENFVLNFTASLAIGLAIVIILVARRVRSD